MLTLLYLHYTFGIEMNIFKKIIHLLNYKDPLKLENLNVFNDIHMRKLKRLCMILKFWSEESYWKQFIMMIIYEIISIRIFTKQVFSYYLPINK